eukprot:6942588-Heterocapsa_arctica.AAC.1
MRNHNNKHNGAVSGGAPGAPGPWVCGCCWSFRIALAGHVLEIRLWRVIAPFHLKSIDPNVGYNTI